MRFITKKKNNMRDGFRDLLQIDKVTQASKSSVIIRFFFIIIHFFSFILIFFEFQIDVYNLKSLNRANYKDNRLKIKNGT